MAPPRSPRALHRKRRYPPLLLAQTAADGARPSSAKAGRVLRPRLATRRSTRPMPSRLSGLLPERRARRRRVWQSRALVRSRRPKAAARLAARATNLHDARRRDWTAPEKPTLRRFHQADLAELRGRQRSRPSRCPSRPRRARRRGARHQASTVSAAGQYSRVAARSRPRAALNPQLWIAYNAPLGAQPLPPANYRRNGPADGGRSIPRWSMRDAADGLPHQRGEPGCPWVDAVIPTTAKDDAARLGVSGGASRPRRPERQSRLRSTASYVAQFAGVAGPAAQGDGLDRGSPRYRVGATVRDKGDPLLWIEGLPHSETRGMNIVPPATLDVATQPRCLEGRVALAQGLSRLPRLGERQRGAARERDGAWPWPLIRIGCSAQHRRPDHFRHPSHGGGQHFRDILFDAVNGAGHHLAPRR